MWHCRWSFYAYLTAKGRLRSFLYGIPACFGALALAVVEADGLTLGIGTAMMVLACHRDFDTRKMRRGAVVGVMFFAWAYAMHCIRAITFTQGRRLDSGQVRRTPAGLPAGDCLPGHLGGGCAWRAHRGKPEISLCMLGRVLTVLLLAAGAGLFVLATFLAGIPQPGGAGQFLCL